MAFHGGVGSPGDQLTVHGNRRRSRYGNEVIADLFVKPLTESCRDPAKTALKFEGAVTIQQSFQVLGQVAGMELFSNPQVAAGMTELDKHFDPAKLKVLTDEAASP